MCLHIAELSCVTLLTNYTCIHSLLHCDRIPFTHLHAGPHTFSSPSGMFLNSPHGFSCDPETLRNTDAQLGLLNRDNPLTPIMPRGSSSSLRSALGGGGAPLNNEFRYRTFFRTFFWRVIFVCTGNVILLRFVHARMKSAVWYYAVLQVCVNTALLNIHPALDAYSCVLMYGLCYYYNLSWCCTYCAL
jgi:hypothetical protein